jgi:hypothetical protein
VNTCKASALRIDGQHRVTRNGQMNSAPRITGASGGQRLPPGSAGRLLSGVPRSRAAHRLPGTATAGPLDMSARPSIPVCEIPGCGKPAAVVMRAPAEVPGKEHPLCPAHASWIARKLGRVGVTYTSRPLAAA